MSSDLYAMSLTTATKEIAIGLKAVLIPRLLYKAMRDVAISRDNGATASDKSNELLLHMGIAVIGTG